MKTFRAIALFALAAALLCPPTAAEAGRRRVGDPTSKPLAFKGLEHEAYPRLSGKRLGDKRQAQTRKPAALLASSQRGKFGKRLAEARLAKQLRGRSIAELKDEAFRLRVAYVIKEVFSDPGQIAFFGWRAGAILGGAGALIGGAIDLIAGSGGATAAFGLGIGAALGWIAPVALLARKSIYVSRKLAAPLHDAELERRGAR